MEKQEQKGKVTFWKSLKEAMRAFSLFEFPLIFYYNKRAVYAVLFAYQKWILVWITLEALLLIIKKEKEIKTFAETALENEKNSGKKET